MRGGHRSRLTGGRWRRRRRPEGRPVPAGPRSRELPREVDSEGAEAAVRVRVQVVGVGGSPPGRFLLDEGVRPQRRVRGSQRGVRGGRGVEVQDGSPLRSRADGQGRAAGARAPRQGRQQGAEVTHIRPHRGGKPGQPSGLGMIEYQTIILQFRSFTRFSREFFCPSAF